jgi:hypothetical protein
MMTLSYPPLRVLIVPWPNRNLMISALYLMFVATSQDRLIDAVSLSTVCRPNVFDSQDCFELGLQILGASRDASSGTLRDTIQQLFCSRQTTRFSTLSFPDVFPIDIHSFNTFPFPDPLLGSNTWYAWYGFIRFPDKNWYPCQLAAGISHPAIQITIKVIARRS